VARVAPASRQGRGTPVQGCPLGAAQEPRDLTDDQTVTLRKLKRRGGDLWRADALKVGLRAVFAGDLSEDEVGMLLDRFCSKALRRLKPFVTAARTIRRVRLIVNRAYGFHSADAALASS